MSEWSPQIVRIEKVEKHPDADTLSIYTVLGDYPVIDKIGKYSVGDLAAYICIDTIVPDTADYYFLCPVIREQYEENGEIKTKIVGNKYELGKVPERNRVIKAKKIRGRYSQGMLVPPPAGLELGASVVEALQLKKLEEENEDNVTFRKLRGANAAPPPKDWAIPFYDIEGFRKYGVCFRDDEEVVISEKLNGSNASFCHDGEQLFVKSRNWYKRRDEDDMWWDIAIRYELESKLVKFPMMVFFGECVGQVKGFRYDAQIENGRLATKLFLFDIWDVKQMKFLDYDDFVSMAKEANLPIVPELYKGKYPGREAVHTYAEGKTILGGKHIREGVVIKPVKERFEERMDSRMQLKLIGEGYTLNK